jgi:hypothetical protein
LTGSPQLHLYQATVVAVNEVKGPIAVVFGFSYVVAGFSDRPVLAQAGRNPVGGILVWKHGSHPADIGHAGELHSWLAKQLAGDRREFLQALGDDRLAFLGGVVAQIGRDSREWLGMLAAPPFDDPDRLLKLGSFVPDGPPSSAAANKESARKRPARSTLVLL